MDETATGCDDSIIELMSALDLSLLHYVSEAEPWIDAQETLARPLLERLSEEQRRSANEIADLLADRRLLPERINFPSDFALLHYLSLTYLLNRIVDNQHQVVAVVDHAARTCCSDPSSRIIQRVRTRECEVLAELTRFHDSLHERRQDVPPIV